MITPHPSVTSGARKGAPIIAKATCVPVDSLQKQEGRQAPHRFLLLGGRTEALTGKRAGEGKIICLHNPDSVGWCLSMRKMHQFNHRARVCCIVAVFSTMGDRVFNHRFERSEPQLRSDSSPVSDQGGSTTLETYYRLRVITPPQ
jgi:hypothetical protein